jgi:hypothetical protein
MRFLVLALLLGCASPTMTDLSQCEFQPGDVVRTVSRGELGQVVAVHIWDSEGCVNDVVLGGWVVEDMRPGQLIHAY